MAESLSFPTNGLPPRDPSESLRFAIYEYDANGTPWIVAEYGEDIKRWECRFCPLKFPDMFKMREHVLRSHLNG